MEKILTEAANQAPALVVLVFLVIVFLRHIKLINDANAAMIREIHAENIDARRHSAEVIEKNTEAVGRNSEVMEETTRAIREGMHK